MCAYIYISIYSKRIAAATTLERMRDRKKWEMCVSVSTTLVSGVVVVCVSRGWVFNKERKRSILKELGNQLEVRQRQRIFEALVRKPLFWDGHQSRTHHGVVSLQEFVCLSHHNFRFLCKNQPKIKIQETLTVFSRPQPSTGSWM